MVAVCKTLLVLIAFCKFLELSALKVLFNSALLSAKQHIHSFLFCYEWHVYIESWCTIKDSLNLQCVAYSVWPWLQVSHSQHSYLSHLAAGVSRLLWRVSSRGRFQAYETDMCCDLCSREKPCSLPTETLKRVCGEQILPQVMWYLSLSPALPLTAAYETNVSTLSLELIVHALKDMLMGHRLPLQPAGKRKKKKKKKIILFGNWFRTGEALLLFFLLW